MTFLVLLIFFWQCSQWYIFIMNLECNSFSCEWEREKFLTVFRDIEDVIVLATGKIPAGKEEKFPLDLYEIPTARKILSLAFLGFKFMENVMLFCRWKDSNAVWLLCWGLVIIWEEVTYPHLAQFFLNKMFSNGTKLDTKI